MGGFYRKTGRSARMVRPHGRPMGRRPHRNHIAVCYFTGMNILLLMVVLLLLFGGGGFYFGGPVIGGSGLGLVLLICLVVFLMGGFRTTKS